jgi:ABC-type multidrug transport system fused ATPase/permease subunit
MANLPDDEKARAGFLGAKQGSTNFKDRLHGTFNVLCFAVTAVYRAGALLLLWLTVTTILSGLMPAAIVYVAKLVLDAIITMMQDGAGPGQLAALAKILGLQLVTIGASGLFNETHVYLTFLAGRRLSVSMNAKVLTKVSTLDYAFFDNSQFYDMMTRAARESGVKPLVLVLKITSIIRGGIILVSMGGVVASFSIPLLVAMLVVCLPLLLVRLRYGEQGYSLAFGRTEEQRMAQYVSEIMTRRQYIPEILSFGLSRHLFGKWHSASRKFVKQDMQLHKRRTIVEGLASALAGAATVGATGYIVYACVSNRLSVSVGDIMMYSGAFAGGLGGLRTALEGVSGIYENGLFLHDYLRFDNLQPHVEGPKDGEPVPAVVESIELQNVSFRYPGSRLYALKNISVKFNRSQSTLIVGPNGAGKTTLISLLIRLYEPTEGRILLNGVDVRRFQAESLRKSIGVVFQQFIRYAFSVEENIGYGSVCDLQDGQRIIAAAKRAKADLFIRQLPQEYQTRLSKLFEGGQELSLGQWQRICLARLFMKDAPVLAFDEPTAALDIETEVRLPREIARLSREKMCILVSHRIFRQSVANQIVVLNDGQIVESGSPEQLVSGNGEFARLWRLYYQIVTEPPDGCLTAL